MGNFKTVNCKTKKNATINANAMETFLILTKIICPISVNDSCTVAYCASFARLSADISPLEPRAKAITAIIGPIEHIAIRPKLFSLELRPPIVVAIPTPNAIINGTVMGPVVTPPESNDKAKKLFLPLSISIAPKANSII